MTAILSEYVPVEHHQSGPAVTVLQVGATCECQVDDVAVAHVGLLICLAACRANRSNV